MSGVFFFFDKGAQHGILVNQLQGFERWLNQTYLAKEKIKLKIIYIPVRQDKLLDYLTEGRGDLVAANMTVTPTRREQVTFSNPVIAPIEEWVVSQHSLPTFNRITQLSGRRVWDGDLLEMVAAGIIPAHRDRQLQGADLARHDQRAAGPQVDPAAGQWPQRLGPVQQQSELLKAVNDYLADAGKRTLYSDMALRRLLARNDQMSNILAPDPLGRLSTIRKVLEQQADKYRLDWLMLAALAYKESGLNANIRSERGAVGIMQLLPSTGGEVGIRGARLASLEGNVEAACRYMRLILDTYFNDPKLDVLNRHLFALAAYNAGPNRVQALRAKAEAAGLDPNVWFGNVEQLVANEVGQGPINYVSTIYKYYVAYRFSLPQLEGKAAAIEAVAQP
ncbi:UNVERIFIED_CONTAM: hypothetical protein K2H54_000291 [Gekko kuhli]